MSPETRFNLALVSLVLSVLAFCALLLNMQMQKLHAGYVKMAAEAQALGIDPDVARLHFVAKVQASQQGGWHPIERVAERMAMRAWKRSL